MKIDKLFKKKFIPKARPELETDIEDFRLNVLYRSILENVSSGVALIDNKGMFLLYNQEFLRLFGLSEQSTIINVNDQKWSDWQVFNENLELLHVDQHPVRQAAIKGTAVKNQLVGVRLPSGGDLSWMLVSAQPLINSDGNVERIICTYQDVTEHRLVDIALRKSEDRLRLALEAAELGTWDLDIASGKIIHSLRHDQIFGYKELQKEWTFETALSHIIPEDRQKFLDASNNPDKPGELSLEARILWPDGSIHWISSLGRKQFNSRGQAVRIIGVVADITERKMAEKALKENEEHLRELNTSKDKFFSIIAHDLKSPFTSIIGFSDLLVEKIHNKEYNDVELYSKMILKSSWLAMDLLTNLFEWSRLQTGRLEYIPGELDLISVIRETINLMNITADQKSITITSQLPDKLNVEADKYMISSVLRNLISNAIKFTYPGGKIEVSTEIATGDVVVTISDNGMGISLEGIRKLFRMDASYSLMGTQGEEGTGLGLLLVKDFITKHGGSICVESKAGLGSKFSFSLPLGR